MSGAYLAALAGGALIGLAATLLLAANGRVAGISGILAGALRSDAGERTWRIFFLVGLVGAGVVARVVRPEAFDPERSNLLPIAVAGVVVGFGTRLGGGCTSGHGVCGLGRGSGRSLVATIVFMATAAITVFVTRHLVGRGS
jgi:uncharacterized membrane protein YedE/YeeE